VKEELIEQVARRRDDFIGRIGAELDRAYAKHGAEQWSRHEFYGILKEEVDELWSDIKNDIPQDTLEKELVQVAAMCLRYFETRDRIREPAENLTEIRDKAWRYDELSK
jgi:hypothetical protein